MTSPTRAIAFGDGVGYSAYASLKASRAGSEGDLTIALTPADAASIGDLVVRLN